jgi:hypothetical protein
MWIKINVMRIVMRIQFVANLRIGVVKLPIKLYAHYNAHKYYQMIHL